MDRMVTRERGFAHREIGEDLSLLQVVYKIIPFIYMLGSVYLFVESIRQLWYLPPKAYVVASWSLLFPPSFLMYEDMLLFKSPMYVQSNNYACRD